jgi:glucosamine--fructose-6-phosphate aminotransferase (isomerizing)
VLGRGPGYAIAHEAALKLKETASLHAEACSGAEVLHGPLAIVDEGFPVLVFLPEDEARDTLQDTLGRLSAIGAAVFVASAGEIPGTLGGRVTRLPVAPTGHPFTDPLAAILAFYRFVERLARLRGLDPDRPPHLQKVTRTR